MYRPTVRYDDVYKKYVNDVFHATNLDRNQIIRLALFLLPHTKEGQEFLSQHLKKDFSLPSARWMVNDGWLWMERQGKSRLEGGTSGKEVSVKNNSREDGRHENKEGYSRPLSRREGEVYQNRTGTGGIRIVVGGSQA
ncbi:hypothetical protein DCC39_18025 [Pueribacillus theae]|uniref:Uncharacterized protein n=1 Tax=Pueribacillus theae TaxID=2171751 RepID=A0A2U1JKG2_9BACI|nr:hypothetical protein [Pueribacillus theae]PWA05484.1 hypothetical protein DCC39_18025 [Pueribacillus theae]